MSKALKHQSSNLLPNFAFIDSQNLNLGVKPTLEHKVGDKIIIKGNVDAELVLHTMIHFKHYHQAIIVSGDGDFHCLVEYLYNHHKLLRILTPNRHYSKLLHEYNELVVRIDLLKTNLQLDEKTKKTKISVRSKP